MGYEDFWIDLTHHWHGKKREKLLLTNSCSSKLDRLKVQLMIRKYLLPNVTGMVRIGVYFALVYTSHWCILKLRIVDILAHHFAMLTFSKTVLSILSNQKVRV
jgi:hypothetical protein